MSVRVFDRIKRLGANFLVVFLAASCSLGAAQASLEAAIDYQKTRKQFGRPLIDFQWNQFKLAEMATKVVASRFLIRKAAETLQNKQPETVALCSLAKLHATESCFEVFYGFSIGSRVENYRLVLYFR